VSERNLGSPDVWAQSLQRSRSRRSAAVAAARSRLRVRGSAASALVVIVVMGAAAALAVAQPVMKQGAKGKGVSAVQKKVGVKPDGVYGKDTKKAVRKYQKKHDLTADGKAGPETVGSLGVKKKKAKKFEYPKKASGFADEPKKQGRADKDKVKKAKKEHGKKHKGRRRVPAVLKRIAECESGGNPRATSGQYRGKYQFSRETWRSVGGKGDPAKASEREQDKRAMKLYKRSGTKPWGCA
jgi:hypothetical protein